jgi:hypothetical protein
MAGTFALYLNVSDLSFSLSPNFATPIENPLALTQGLDVLTDLYFVTPTGNPSTPWNYLDPVSYTFPQIGIAQTNQSVPPFLAELTAFTYNAASGSNPPFLEGLLSLSSSTIAAALGNSPSLKAIFEVDWVNGPQELIIQCACVIGRSVFFSGGSPPLPPLSYSLFIQNRIGSLTAVSSGAGTLSGIATASSQTALNTAVIFLVSGITNGWFLRIGTDITSGGIQRPDDFNASTNAVVWQQFL